MNKKLAKKLACTLPIFALLFSAGCASTDKTTDGSRPEVQSSETQPAVTRTLDYRGASVLPVTGWPTKPGVRYALLAQEAHGQDAGTFGDWGGSRDPHENDPAITAAREFNEETMRLLEWQTASVGTAKTMEIVNEHKKMVTFVSEFDHEVLEKFVKEFHRERNRLLQSGADRHLLEMKSLGWIPEDELRNVIAHASRDAQGRLNLPVTAQVNVVHPDGHTSYQDVSLRPVFVSKLQEAFTDRR